MKPAQDLSGLLPFATAPDQVLALPKILGLGVGGPAIRRQRHFCVGAAASEEHPLRFPFQPPCFFNVGLKVLMHGSDEFLHRLHGFACLYRPEPDFIDQAAERSLGELPARGVFTLPAGSSARSNPAWPRGVKAAPRGKPSGLRTSPKKIGGGYRRGYRDSVAAGKDRETAGRGGGSTRLGHRRRGDYAYGEVPGASRLMMRLLAALAWAGVLLAQRKPVDDAWDLLIKGQRPDAVRLLRE